jgi:uncharacterized protein
MQWIRSSFPQARVTAPGGAYARIRHPLREGGLALRRHGPLPDDALFLDLETLGFLGHPVFLVGLLRRSRRSGDWEVLQLLARDYTEEEAILRAFVTEGRRRPRWVSFNGKSFDVPTLRGRAAFYGLEVPEPAEHLDLLHTSRRIYRGVLPNCRLQTLESRLFGHYRVRDLAGAEIPAAYHAFVRGADPEIMGRILLHNRDDLVTLVRLHLHLQEPGGKRGGTP